MNTCNLNSRYSEVAREIYDYLSPDVTKDFKLRDIPGMSNKVKMLTSEGWIVIYKRGNKSNIPNSYKLSCEAIDKFGGKHISRKMLLTHERCRR